MTPHLEIYNTLSRRKERFQPLHEGEVRMYVCGVTVYDDSHIGHARSATVFDVVARYLAYVGYRVTFVRNFTDIEDKIIARAQKEGVPWQEITERYIRSYTEDVDALGMLKPTFEPRATDHIQEMIDLIAILIAKGRAYAVDGDVFFSVRSLPAYGKLSGKNIEDLESGARVDVDARKRDPLDFALWKSAKPGEPSWKSPWGLGRPGWHIECSAMSARYLDQPFDIHGGGEDLIFPHHENEIAQSEGALGGEFARYWLHNGFLNINKEKMSKSLGNFFKIKEILARYEPEAVRMFFLSAHYRSPVEFSDLALDEATERVEKIYRAVIAAAQRRRNAMSTTLRVGPAKGKGADEAQQAVESAEKNFRVAMDDDFNTAKALAVVFETVRALNKLTTRDPGTTGDTQMLSALEGKVRTLSGVLGLLQDNPEAFVARVRERRAAQLGIDPEWVVAQLRARDAARAAKDWSTSDQIRDALAAKRVAIEDSPGGSDWRIETTRESE